MGGKKIAAMAQNKKNKFLWNVGMKYASKCSAVSRDCLSALTPSFRNSQVCYYCGSVYAAGNYTMKLIPRRRVSVRCRRLMRKNDASAKRIINSVEKCTPKFCVKCLCCNKERNISVKLKSKCVIKKAKEVLMTPKNISIMSKKSEETNAGLIIPSSLLVEKKLEVNSGDNFSKPSMKEKRKKHKHEKIKDFTKQPVTKVKDLPKKHATKIKDLPEKCASRIKDLSDKRASRIKDLPKKPASNKRPFNVAKLQNSFKNENNEAHVKSGLKAFLMDLI